MRQMQVHVRAHQASSVLAIAEDHDAIATVCADVRTQDGPGWSLLMMNLPNDRVGAFVRAVEQGVEDARFVLIPRGVIPLETPLKEVRSRVRSVSRRSDMELVLDALQSVGSWQVMLLYALFSGVIAAYAVIFDASYLLIAGMLIAPMGAPAMVSVVGAVVGDGAMVRRGATRFFASIAVLVACAALLGLAYQLSVSTPLMEQITNLSALTVLGALVAGAAGAQAQVTDDRSSLVSGTTAGFLVAAALSPTSAVLGLGIVLRRWDYVSLMSFQIALQYAGIVLGGWTALAAAGVRPESTTLGRGSRLLRWVVPGVLAVVVGGMVLWQLHLTPRFRKADLSRDAVVLARDAAREVEQIRLLRVLTAFTRPDLQIGPREGLIVEVVAARQPGPASAQELQTRLQQAVSQGVRAGLPRVVPYVNVTVVPGDSLGSPR